MPHQVVLCDRRGVPQEELANAQVESLTWALSDVGGGTISLKQDDPQVTAPLLLENEVQVFIDEWPDQAVVPWWGVWWRCRDTARKAVFEVQTLESYLTKRFIDTRSLYWADADGNDVETEQLAIGWALMAYAQDGLDKDLFITNGTYPPSGKTRLRRYNRDEHQQILELLKEFPNLVDFTTGASNGFDWQIQGYRNGRREWTPYYPQRGTLRADLTLELGRNVSDFDVDEDAVNLATKTYATGGSTGDIKIEANYRDNVASARHGEMLAVISHGDQKDPAALRDFARSHTELRNRPIITPKVKAVRVPVELLGTIMPGDTVPVSIRRGRVNVEENMRVQSVTWKPGANTVELNFIPKVGGA